MNLARAVSFVVGIAALPTLNYLERLGGLDEPRKVDVGLQTFDFWARFLGQKSIEYGVLWARDLNEFRDAELFSFKMESTDLKEVLGVLLESTGEIKDTAVVCFKVEKPSDSSFLVKLVATTNQLDLPGFIRMEDDDYCPLFNFSKARGKVSLLAGGHRIASLSKRNGLLLNNYLVFRLLWAKEVEFRRKKIEAVPATDFVLLDSKASALGFINVVQIIALSTWMLDYDRITVEPVELNGIRTVVISTFQLKGSERKERER